MKCQKCGQEVSENNRFCPQCGAKLEMYFFWDIEVEFNSETMGKSKIVQGKKIVLDSEAMVEELKKAESQIISLYSSMNIEDENSIRNIREQIKEISQKYNIAFTIVEELDYRLKKIKGTFEKEKLDSGKKEESKSGIFIDGSFENLKNMVEKNDKRHSTESVIIFFASLIILFFEGKAWIRELMSSFGNKWAFMWAVYDVVMYIFFDALIAYVVWRISERFIYKNKQKISEMCLNMLVINDVQALYNALLSLKIKAIKKVYYNEYGCLCVEGKHGTYGFPIEDQKIKYRYDKNRPELSGVNDLKGTLEKNTIIVSLLKELSYQAPVNAYKESKNNKRLMRAGKEIKAVLILSVVLIAGGIFVQHDIQYIYMVQNVCPEAYSDISYKKSFKEYFTNGKWKHFESTEQDNVVEFDGKGIYDGKESEVKIQFILTEQDENVYDIELGAIAVDEEVLNTYEKIEYIANIFNRYENVKTK